MCLQPEDFPRVMIGIFFEEATPFADVFFEHVAEQIYPKDRIDIYIHYGVSRGSLLYSCTQNQNDLFGCCCDYRVTATAPEYDLLLAIRQRRLRYLGHILRMPECRVVRRALVALAKGGSVYPKGSLFMDCQTMKFHQLVALAQRRGAWNALATQLR